MRGPGRLGLVWVALVLHATAGSGGGGLFGGRHREGEWAPESGRRRQLTTEASLGTTLREDEAEPPWPSRWEGTPETLKALASRVAEILDRISRNWALEGAKTIQTGEMRLRKLNKDVAEKIGELVLNGSKFGRHVRQCMNRTAFEDGLEETLSQTTECYGSSILNIQFELKKVETEEESVLQRMENHSKRIFDLLSGCFLKESPAVIIECLQRVDAMDLGNEIGAGGVTDLLIETAAALKEIPRRFSECTTKGVVQTEALLRRGYAQALTCLKERPK